MLGAEYPYSPSITSSMVIKVIAIIRFVLHYHCVSFFKCWIFTLYNGHVSVVIIRVTAMSHTVCFKRLYGKMKLALTITTIPPPTLPVAGLNIRTSQLEEDLAYHHCHKVMGLGSGTDSSADLNERVKKTKTNKQTSIQQQPMFLAFSQQNTR